MKRWGTVQVRTAVLERIACYLDSRTDPTITNTTQFVDLALREKLEGARRDNRK